MFEKIIDIYNANPNFKSLQNLQISNELTFARIDTTRHYSYVIVRKLNDSIIVKFVNKDFLEHRENGAAYILFRDDGTIVWINYSKNGKFHRENGPAIIQYKNGKITKETWFINGNMHRVGKPADITYDENGNIVNEIYYVNNKVCTELQSLVSI